MSWGGFFFPQWIMFELDRERDGEDYRFPHSIMSDFVPFFLALDSINDTPFFSSRMLVHL
jgi:hypothetical protein